MGSADAVVFFQFENFLEQEGCLDAGLATRVWGILQREYAGEVPAAPYASMPISIFKRAIRGWKSIDGLGRGARDWMEAFLEQ